MTNRPGITGITLGDIDWGGFSKMVQIPFKTK